MYFNVWVLWQFSVGWKIDFCLEHVPNLLSAWQRNSLRFMSFTLLTPKASVQMKLKTQLPSSVEQPHPTDGCGPFANYQSQQVIHISISIWSSMPSKLVSLPVASPVACAFSSTLLVASKLIKREMSQCLIWFPLTSRYTHTPHTHTHTCKFNIMIMIGCIISHDAITMPVYSRWFFSCGY